MRALLHDLRCNLAAGLRLALLRPVRRLDFRISLAQLVATGVVGAICASLVDLAVIRGAAEFNTAGLGGHFRDTMLLLALAWIVASLLRVPRLALTLAVIFLASGWVADLTFAAVVMVLARVDAAAAWQLGLWWIVLVWSLVVTWRVISVALQGARRFGLVARVLAVAAVFGGTLAIAL